MEHPKCGDSLAEYFLTNLLESANDDSDLCASVDLTLLSLMYALHRKNGFKVLFSHLVDIYEEHFECAVERTKLLDFYNSVFIMRMLPTELLGRMRVRGRESENESAARVDCKQEHPHKEDYLGHSSAQSKMRGSALKYENMREEKESILGLF